MESDPKRRTVVTLPPILENKTAKIGDDKRGKGKNRRGKEEIVP